MTDITEDHWVQLATLKTKRGALPQLLLTVHRWKEVEESKGKVSATLTLYECDTNWAGGRNAPIGQFRLRLKADKGATGSKPRVKIVSASWKRDSRFSGKKMDGIKVPSLKSPFERFPKDMRAFRLAFAGTSSKHYVSCQEFSSGPGGDTPEGTSFEIGFTLEVDGGKTYERLRETGDQGGAFAHIPVNKNWLKHMLAFPKRFDDRQNLSAQEKALEQDGRPIWHFLDGRSRQAMIRHWRAECGLKEGFKQDQVGYHDIAKVWFVIHDVGNKGKTTNLDTVSRKASSLRLWFKKNKAGTKVYEMSVHGYLNPEGTYVSINDFRSERNGTKFESTSTGKPYRGYCIHIETVPGIITLGYDRAQKLGNLKESERKDNPDWVLVGSAGQLQKRGHQILKYYEDNYALVRKVQKAGGHISWKWFRPKNSAGKKLGKLAAYCVLWTDELMDQLANLYLFASYRAGHLLTITCHVEMDRHLKNGHNDPRGMDVQDLYDRITTKLHKYRGIAPAIQKGDRYGIHPDRIRVNDATATNFGQAIGPKFGSDKQMWPLQSQPKVQKK